MWARAIKAAKQQCTFKRWSQQWMHPYFFRTGFLKGYLDMRYNGGTRKDYISMANCSFVLQFWWAIRSRSSDHYLIVNTRLPIKQSENSKYTILSNTLFHIDICSPTWRSQTPSLGSLPCNWIYLSMCSTRVKTGRTDLFYNQNLHVWHKRLINNMLQFSVLTKNTIQPSFIKPHARTFGKWGHISFQVWREFYTAPKK